MFTVSHVIYNIHGLGRFILRPLKFYKKKKNLKILIEKFSNRRDDRGIMIRNELLKRYSDFENITITVDDFNNHIKRKMFKQSIDEKTESILEK